MARKKKVKNAKSEAKKLIVAVVAAVIVFIGLFMIFSDGSSNNFKKHVEEISYSEFQNKLENGESFILFYGSSSCSACEAYKPTFADAVEKTDGLTVYSVDIDNFNQTDREAIAYELGTEYTPEVHMYINGIHEATALQGAKSEAETVVFFGKYLSKLNVETGE